MTNPFGNLTNDGLEEAEDRLGGGYQPLDTDMYMATIKAAYAGKSAGGAQNVTILADVNGREYRETIYITNKKGENFFLNKEDNSKKVPLPGFTTIDDLCLITTEQPLAAQPVEDKMLKIWDPEQRKEMPKSVPVLVDLTGKQVLLAIGKLLENKNEKDSSGNYVPTADTRESNVIEKVLHPELKITVVEAKNSAEGPAYHDAWLEKNRGNVRDRRTIKDGQAGEAGRPSRGAPAAGAAAGRPKSLFGNKQAA